MKLWHVLVDNFKAKLRALQGVRAWGLLVAGAMTVAGFYWPRLNLLLPAGLALPLYQSLRGHLDRHELFYFFLPYTGLVWGWSAWSVLPYRFGALLGILLANDLARLMVWIHHQRRRFSAQAWLLVYPTVVYFLDLAVRGAPLLRDIETPSLYSSLYDLPTLLCSTAVFGRSALAFFIVLAANLAAAVVVAVLHERQLHRILVSAAVLVLVAVLVLGAGQWVAEVREIELAEGGQIRVAALQASLGGQHTETGIEFYDAAFRDYVGLWPHEEVDVVVFPELPVGIYDTAGIRFTEHVERLQRLATDRDTLLAALVVEGSSKTRAREQRHLTALLMGPDGTIGRYRKHHLVPFASSRYSPGTGGYPVFETQLGRLGMAICYDFNFEPMQELRTGGAQLVLGLFNDSGFDRAYHNAHRFYAVRQAAQYGLPVAMANEDGISQLVNARGDVVAESGIGQQTALVSTLRLRRGDALNIYQSIGRKSELFLPLFLALAILLDIWREEGKPTSN